MKQSLNLMLAATILLLSRPFALAQGPAHSIELTVRGSSLIDGSGSPAIKAGIGITGDRIVFVGPSLGEKQRAGSALPVSLSPQASSILTPTGADDLSDSRTAIGGRSGQMEPERKTALRLFFSAGPRDTAVLPQRRESQASREPRRPVGSMLHREKGLTPVCDRAKE